VAKRSTPPQIDESDLLDSTPLGSGEIDDLLVLSLSDLLPGNHGELVLFSGDNAPVNLLAADAVVSQGVAENHITADGIDVTGLSFLSFATGITVYFPTDLSLTVNYEA
jgi:hypothetical protein